MAGLKEKIAWPGKVGGSSVRVWSGSVLER